MTSKPLRFHPQAEQEYLTALAWYRDRSLIAAINFERAIEQAVERVRESPQRWPIYFADNMGQTPTRNYLGQPPTRPTIANVWGTRAD